MRFVEPPPSLANENMTHRFVRLRFHPQAENSKLKLDAEFDPVSIEALKDHLVEEYHF